MPSEGTLVLVVDDDADIQETVELILRMEGCQVLRAATGGEACRTLSRIARGELQRPRLMLLDLMLPDMEGEDVFAYLRGLGEEMTSIPVTVVSAAVDGAARAEAMGVRHMPKPFDLSEILELLGRAAA
jgi:CheY-like chemotaxis protein